MATRREAVEWVAIDGVPYTTELEAILHDVGYAFKPKAPNLCEVKRPAGQMIEVAKQLLDFAIRKESEPVMPPPTLAQTITNALASEGIQASVDVDFPKSTVHVSYFSPVPDIQLEARAYMIARDNLPMGGSVVVTRVDI